MEFKALADVLDNLPQMNIDGIFYTPIFDYGSHEDLIKFLRLKNKGNVKNVYPLIWLETPVSFEYTSTIFEVGSLSFVVATISNATLSNRERTDGTFEITLDPLVKTIVKELRAKPWFSIAEETIVTTKYFKYDSDNENYTPEIWDAIKLELDISINKNCLIT